MDLQELRSSSIEFLQSLSRPDGSWPLARREPPTAWGTAGAALAIDVLDAWDAFPEDQNDRIAAYLNRQQDGEGKVAADIEWSECITARHDPVHVIWGNCREAAWAYHCCGHLPGRPYRFVNRFLNPDYLIDWLDYRVWDVNPWLEGNKILSLHTCLHMFGLSDPEVGPLLPRLFEGVLREWLDERFVESMGLWGSANSPAPVLQAIGCAPHILPLYIAFGWSVPDMSPCIETVLRFQEEQDADGLFMEGGDTSVDFDGVYLLYNACRQSGHMPGSVRDCFERYVDRACKLRNADGGFPMYAAIPDRQCYNGYVRHGAEGPISTTMSTWFYLSSLAMAAALLEGATPDDIGFHFGENVFHLKLLK